MLGDGMKIRDLPLTETKELMCMSRSPQNKVNKALFLDRDGVINVDTGYAHKWQEMILIDGIIELIIRFKMLGYLIVVVTNQSGIGRGYYSDASFRETMAQMGAFLASKGAAIDAYYYCSCDPTKTSCENRKPNSGMLVKAADELQISLQDSLLIGDKMSDVEAGKKAGLIKSILIGGDINGSISGICHARDLGQVMEMCGLRG